MSSDSEPSVDTVTGALIYARKRGWLDCQASSNTEEHKLFVDYGDTDGDEYSDDFSDDCSESSIDENESFLLDLPELENIPKFYENDIFVDDEKKNPFEEKMANIHRQHLAFYRLKTSISNIHSEKNRHYDENKRMGFEDIEAQQRMAFEQSANNLRNELVSGHKNLQAREQLLIKREQDFEFLMKRQVNEMQLREKHLHEKELLLIDKEKKINAENNRTENSKLKLEGMIESIKKDSDLVNFQRKALQNFTTVLKQDMLEIQKETLSTVFTTQTLQRHTLNQLNALTKSKVSCADSKHIATQTEGEAECVGSITIPDDWFDAL